MILEALYLVLLLFLSYCHIINMFLHRRLLLSGTWPSSMTRLKDAERLRLYFESAFSEKKALSVSLMEAESKSRHLESEAREKLLKGQFVLR